MTALRYQRVDASRCMYLAALLLPALACSLRSRAPCARCSLRWRLPALLLHALTIKPLLELSRAKAAPCVGAAPACS